MINLKIKVETEFLYKGAKHYSWPFCTLNCVNFKKSHFDLKWKLFIYLYKKLLYLFNADCGFFSKLNKLIKDHG